MASTGTMTLKPRNAAAAPVCSTEVCAWVPIAITVVMPRALSMPSRLLLMNLSGPSGGRTVSPAAGVSSLRMSAGVEPDRDAVDDEHALLPRLGDELRDPRHRVGAARAARRRAGLHGEIHREQRGLA